MRTAIFLFVTVSLVGGLVWFFVLRDPEPEKPTKDPVELFGNTKPKPGTDSPGGGLKPPPLPGGIKGPTLPGIDARKPEEVFAEFAQEMDFSEEQMADFLDALKTSNEGMIDLMQTDSSSGLPKLPDPEEIAQHIEEKERIMTGSLGIDGYEKYKAYTATVAIRGVINEFGGLKGEDKQAVIYGAYEDVRSGTLPATPMEFSEKLNSAILSRSSEYLSDTAQENLKKSLNQHHAKQLEMFGGVGGLPGMPSLPNLPNLPTPPNLPSPGNSGIPLPPGGGPSIPSGAP